MARILLLLEHEENRRLLGELLATYHTVLEGNGVPDLGQTFDLILVDGPVAQRLHADLRVCKRASAPVFLPVLLLSHHAEPVGGSDEVWEGVDDVLSLPVRKAALRARIELLLRTRRLSWQVKRHSDDLQALVQGLSHDLRAPARAASSFAHLLREEYGDAVDATALRYLARVEDASARIQDVLEFLHTFAALGRSRVSRFPLSLDDAVALMVERYAEEIAAAGAQVTVQSGLPEVLADPVLLDMVLSNLISNALKYTVPGIPPSVEITAEVDPQCARLHVQDRGIGIAPEEQVRIWQPFVRLHGEEAYPGTGLGLAIARKAAELMGGELGLVSELGRGCCFWLELPLSGEGEGYAVSDR